MTLGHDISKKKTTPESFKVQMKYFFYCWIWKSSENQEDRRLLFLNISSSSRDISV